MVTFPAPSRNLKWLVPTRKRWFGMISRKQLCVSGRKWGERCVYAGGQHLVTGLPLVRRVESSHRRSPQQKVDTDYYADIEGDRTIFRLCRLSSFSQLNGHFGVGLVLW